LPAGIDRNPLAPELEAEGEAPDWLVRRLTAFFLPVGKLGNAGEEQSVVRPVFPALKALNLSARNAWGSADSGA
jgi:hypothetical protein